MKGKVNPLLDRVSEMLCADWLSHNKLPPYIVYKGSTARTGQIRRELEDADAGYPEDCIVRCTKSLVR